jgi:antitoxin component YwqK of YwqJK toxin-antitoxin module
LLIVFAGFSLSANACDSAAVTKYSNGNKSLIAKFEKGNPCGKWRYFDEEQHLIKKEKYINGLLVFSWSYNKKGKITETINRKGKIRKYKPCNCK